MCFNMCYRIPSTLSGCVSRIRSGVTVCRRTPFAHTYEGTYVPQNAGCLAGLCPSLTWEYAAKENTNGDMTGPTAFPPPFVFTSCTTRCLNHHRWRGSIFAAMLPARKPARADPTLSNTHAVGRLAGISAGKACWRVSSCCACASFLRTYILEGPSRDSRLAIFPSGNSRCGASQGVVRGSLPDMCRYAIGLRGFFGFLPVTIPDDGTVCRLLAGHLW
ncbi:hypothetical protein F5Y15DRAFT_326568 [Xylariaceae sp. FL0016]|nr:hypothetical protein F5Y15DRAFT_326568 [Xylariaceae sp. FL0016]